MAEGKPIRLAKAATTLNVGSDTIIESLDKNGFKVENKPTTKLSPEMYAVLLKEFRGDVNVKEEADLISLGNKRRENIELETTEVPAAPKKQEETKEILVKDATAETETPPPPDEPVKEEVKEEEPPKVEEKVEPVKEEPAKTETVEAETAEPVKEDVEPPKVELKGPKIIGKIDLEKKKPAKKVEPKVEKKVEEVKKAEPKVEKKAEPVKEEPKKPVKPKKEAEVIEHIETQKVSLDGPKIVGKIVLPTKPERKPKETDKSKDKKAGPGDSKRPRRKRIVKSGKVDTEREARNRRRAGGPGSKSKRDPDAPAVSEKEIEDKIKATMAKLAGVSGKSGRSKFRREKRKEHAEEVQKAIEAEIEGEKKLQITEFISVSELASLMNVGATDVISTCMGLGVIVSINQRLDAEIIELVADEFKYEVEFIDAADQGVEEDEVEDDPDTLVERAPIVTIMGHVDHGKTSLLDYIREANVVDKEAGGITQHIGAYEVKMEDGRKITFLDTPGHEAFTAMRARGAKLTDIAVIVIAADDDIMPQTKEAISHAQSAGVPMIFAINKIDKPNASPDNIKTKLAAMNLQVEEWGGKYQSQDLSAKTGENVNDLLEKIILEADILELKANPDRNAIGSIIEASLDKGRGYVATALVQRGTLEVGNIVVSGQYNGKIKAMFDHRGKKVKVAGPSCPVQILGLNGAPPAGEKMKVYENEQDAKAMANSRAQIDREQGLRAQKHITLDEIGRRLALGTFKELNVIIKGDVDGSIEALTDSLQKLSTAEIQVNILHKAVGQITESDILLASASDAIIIGFQVRPSMQARKLAEVENIEIRLYSIIYKAIEEIKAAMEGMLEPKIEEKITANIEIREVFKITKIGTIAGCQVIDGKLKRADKVRVVRDGIVIYSGVLDSLKRFKDDVKEVINGQECGLNIKNFNDIKVGDIVEGYEEVEIQRKL